jgi:hypothetical protein
MRLSFSMMLVVTAGVLTQSPGCERSAPSSTPTDAQPIEPGPNGGDPTPEVARDDTGDGEAEVAENDEQREEDDASAAKGPGDGALTNEAATQLVTVALDEVMDPYAARVITPALPPSWPLEGSTVVYLVYPLTPAEQGVDRYKTTAPLHRVELDVSTREVSVQTLEKPKKLGDYDRPRPKKDDTMDKAEQALLDLAAGRVKPEKVHYLLFGYGRWFEANGSIGADAQKRSSAFATWASTWGR